SHILGAGARLHLRPSQRSAEPFPTAIHAVGDAHDSPERSPPGTLTDDHPWPFHRSAIVPLGVAAATVEPSVASGSGRPSAMQNDLEAQDTATNLDSRFPDPGTCSTDHDPPSHRSTTGSPSALARVPTTMQKFCDTHETPLKLPPVTGGTLSTDHEPPARCSITSPEPPLRTLPTATQTWGALHDTPTRPPPKSAPGTGGAGSICQRVPLAPLATVDALRLVVLGWLWVVDERDTPHAVAAKHSI